MSRSRVAAGAWTDYAVACLAVMRAGPVAVPLPAQRRRGRACPHFGELRDSDHHRRTDAPIQMLVEDGEFAKQALPVVGPDDPAQVLYTSGTQAVPRGVLATHGTSSPG